MNKIEFLEVTESNIGVQSTAFMVIIGAEKVLGFVEKLEKFKDTRSTKNPWRIFGVKVVTNDEGVQWFRYDHNVFYTVYGSKNDAVNMMFEKNLVPVFLSVWDKPK